MTPHTTRAPATTFIKIGLVVLPLYGLLLGYGTLKPQPDSDVDPDGWAHFVSSGSYLAEHLVGNVVGPLLAVLGTVSLGALLASRRPARLGLWGAGLAVAGYVLLMVPGTISTFATPPIGAAYLAGHHDVLALEFSPALPLTTAVALLLTVVGNVVLGVAIWRSDLLPRWAGLVWIVGTLTFYLFGAALGMTTTGASLPTQPIGALLLTISSAGIAWAVRRPQPTRPSDLTQWMSSRSTEVRS